MPMIEERYPILTQAATMYTEFHSAIMGDDIGAIDQWVKKNQSGFLKGFVEAVNNDITPIHNAILYPDSSGFVEGTNSKFKLIKRLFYGRSGRRNLEIRFILSCLFTKDHFSLGDVCPFYDRVAAA